MGLIHKMSKFIQKFTWLLFVSILIGIPVAKSTSNLYSAVVQAFEQAMSNLGETANDLKIFETTHKGLVAMVEVELPKLEKLVQDYNNALLRDDYLTYTLHNFPRFSDPLRVLWGKANETGIVSYTFFHKVSTAVTAITRSYEEKLGKETDQLTSPLLDEFTNEMKSLLSKLILHQFPPSVDSTEKQSLRNLEKLCQSVAVEVGDHETSKQVLERVKRNTNSHNAETIPCTSGDDTELPPSPRSKVLHWTENMDLKIPETLTYAILSCYQLQAADAILQYMNSLYPDKDSGGETQLQELQQRETNLALTAVWIREKFSNQTIHHQKLEEGGGSTQIIRNQNGEAVPTKEIWMCDPKNFEIGVNFIRFSGVLQTCIYNEYALTPHETCSGKCKHCKGPYEHEQDYISEHLSCTTSECKQKMDKKQLLHLQQSPIQCVRMEGEVRICGSDRNDARYNWFSVGSQHFGKHAQNETCKKEVRILKEDWRLENGMFSKIPQLCEICQCQCNHVEKGMKQVAYFSIAEVSSDVEQNMVVTGIRFETKFGIIYTKIETGKLLPSGSVDQSSLVWISPLLMSKEKSLEEDTTLRLGLDFDTIYLDDIEASFRPATPTTSIEHHSILTGIRFRRHKDHISLEAQFTSIDPTTKSLRPHESVWLNRIDDHRRREKLNFRDADDPKLSSGVSAVNSKINQAIQFTSASLEKTAGQVVVPYFDSQPVHSSKRSPIHALGIVMKGQEGYAGFIAFRLSVCKDFLL